MFSQRQMKSRGGFSLVARDERTRIDTQRYFIGKMESEGREAACKSGSEAMKSTSSQPFLNSIDLV